MVPCVLWILDPAFRHYPWKHLPKANQTGWARYQTGELRRVRLWPKCGLVYANMNPKHRILLSLRRKKKKSSCSCSLSLSPSVIGNHFGFRLTPCLSLPLPLAPIHPLSGFRFYCTFCRLPSIQISFRLLLIRSGLSFPSPAMRNRCNLHAYAYRKIKLILRSPIPELTDPLMRLPLPLGFAAIWYTARKSITFIRAFLSCYLWENHNQNWSYMKSSDW